MVRGARHSHQHAAHDVLDSSSLLFPDQSCVLREACCLDNGSVFDLRSLHDDVDQEAIQDPAKAAARQAEEGKDLTTTICIASANLKNKKYHHRIVL